MPFIRTLSEKEFPLHKAIKPIGQDPHGNILQGVKKEKFIFDLLKFTTKVGALVYPREDCFAPLKNKEGKDSPITVKNALSLKDKKRFEILTESKFQHEGYFELGISLHYPTLQDKKFLVGYRLTKNQDFFEL